MGGGIRVGVGVALEEAVRMRRPEAPILGQGVLCCQTHHDLALPGLFPLIPASGPRFPQAAGRGGSSAGFKVACRVRP